MLAGENMKFLGMVGLSKVPPVKMERLPANVARLLDTPLLLHNHLRGGQIFLSHCL